MNCQLIVVQLHGKLTREFSCMFCMDGNNSLKRVQLLAGRKVGDTRVFEESDYFLPKEYMERCANKVRARKTESRKKAVLQTELSDRLTLMS